MRLTRQTNYAVRILMYCAANSGRLSRIPEIAGAYGVSELFLFKILQPLVEARLVETVRGLALDGHLGLHEGKLAFLYGHGLKLRWQEKGERRISWAFGGNHELWRADRLALPQVRRVIVCEGETDAVCLLDAGLESDADVAVVAIPGASPTVIMPASISLAIAFAVFAERVNA